MFTQKYFDCLILFSPQYLHPTYLKRCDNYAKVKNIITIERNKQEKPLQVGMFDIINEEALFPSANLNVLFGKEEDSCVLTYERISVTSGNTAL
jgi:hypothetical protein